MFLFVLISDQSIDDTALATSTTVWNCIVFAQMPFRTSVIDFSDQLLPIETNLCITLKEGEGGRGKFVTITYIKHII